MQRFEFMVIPAPRRGEKARGVKTTEDRFALALTNLMNAMGAEGWDYVRADVLPCDERVGFTGTKTSFLNMLVFRRVIEEEAAPEAKPALTAAQVPTLRLNNAEPVATPTPRLGPAALPLPLTVPAVGPAIIADEAGDEGEGGEEDADVGRDDNKELEEDVSTDERPEEDEAKDDDESETEDGDEGREKHAVPTDQPDADRT